MARRAVVPEAESASQKAARFRLALEQAHVSPAEFAHRLKEPLSSVLNWTRRGVPSSFGELVADTLMVPHPWLDNGIAAPPWYLRLAALDAKLPIVFTGISDASLYQAWLDAIHQRLMERLIDGGSVIELPTRSAIPRATWYRTHGLSYFDALSVDDMAELGRRLGFGSRRELFDRYVAGQRAVAADETEARLRENRERAMGADLAIADDPRAGGGEVDRGGLRLRERLEALASRYENLARQGGDRGLTHALAAQMSRIQGLGLEELITAVPGEGSLSGATAISVMTEMYRFASRLDLIGSDHVSLDRATRLSIAGAFGNRTFRLSELMAHLRAHFGLSVTRDREDTAEARARATGLVVSEDALRICLKRSGVRQVGKLWSTAPPRGTEPVPGVSR